MLLTRLGGGILVSYLIITVYWNYVNELRDSFLYIKALYTYSAKAPENISEGMFFSKHKGVSPEIAQA